MHTQIIKLKVTQFNGISWSAKGNDNYQKLETELVDNKLSQYVQKQLDKRDKTGLINYLLYENGKIVINKKNYTDEIKIINRGLLISNSVGKIYDLLCYRSCCFVSMVLI